MVPVHETVIILYSSGAAPQLTITAGKGYIIVPGFQITLLIFLTLKLIFFTTELHGVTRSRTEAYYIKAVDNSMIRQLAGRVIPWLIKLDNMT